jgi:hypothetical protein
MIAPNSWTSVEATDRWKKGNIMRDRLLSTTIALGIAAAAAVISVSTSPMAAEAPAGSAATAALAPKTPWGEPDLQGIWTEEFDTPFQRPARYANQEYFTQAQRQELDNERSALLGRRATDRDFAGAYNLAVFTSSKHTGARTSLIIDPPNGRIPPLTTEAQKAAAADREFRLALLQSTETCKNNMAQCGGGKYDATPSPRRAEPPPRYLAGNFGRINRYDGPEDGALSDRCLTLGLPEFGTAFGGSFRRIVQTPGGISMFYDVGQGSSWQRNIVMNGSPHLPAGIRQWFGDSRGRWDGDTLVIDVSNFGPKTEFQGSRENLHLIERWTRTSPTTLEYEVTIEDPTVWTRPWTVRQEFTKQSDQENRIYYEPRCVEGNYALPSMLLAARRSDRDFAEGRGSDPAAKDNVTNLVDIDTSVVRDR